MQLIIPGESSVTKLVHHRNYSGEMETVAIEDKGDKRIFHYAQKAGDILNSNETRRINEDTTLRTKDLHQVASVPMVTWLLWESIGITLDQRELRKCIERSEEVKVTNKRVV